MIGKCDDDGFTTIVECVRDIYGATYAPLHQAVIAWMGGIG